MCTEIEVVRKKIRARGEKTWLPWVDGDVNKGRRDLQRPVVKEDL